VAARGAPWEVKLTVSAGFLTFDLWDKTWNRIFSRRGVICALQEAIMLVASVIAICKHVPVHADLLVLAPAMHLFLDSAEVRGHGSCVRVRASGHLAPGAAC
jgi:hypothetical protein